jgi:hypothetical protein
MLMTQTATAVFAAILAILTLINFQLPTPNSQRMLDRGSASGKSFDRRKEIKRKTIFSPELLPSC